MPAKKNSKRTVKKNAAPDNYPMSGVFDMSGFSGVAPSSQPWEMANSASYNLLTLQRVMLTYSYVIFGPIRTLVDQPVYDAFRGGVKIKSDEVSPEDIEALEKELKRLKVWKHIVNALRWDRLYGGAGIIINTDQDYKKPLDPESINEDSMLEFKVGDRWELSWSGIPGDEKSMFSYYGHLIHQSRVVAVVGEEAPSLAAQRLRGWGMSAIECVIREINSYFKEQNVIFELLDEAKVDVWKIKGFNSACLAPAANAKTATRLKIASQMKNFLNAVTLDSEDDYTQKTQTFSGLSEMMEQIRIGIAAAVRMPMAKIFGLASKGFASGEDDIENYNAIVEGQRDRAREVLEIVIPIVCRKVWGFVPDDLDYEFKPLRVLSAEQEQNVLDKKFNRIQALYNSGILNPQEYCQALKDEGIFTMETEVGKGLVDPTPTFVAPGEDGMGGEEGDTGKPSAGKKADEGDAEGKKAKNANLTPKIKKYIEDAYINGVDVYALVDKLAKEFNLSPMDAENLVSKYAHKQYQGM